MGLVSVSGMRLFLPCATSVVVVLGSGGGGCVVVYGGVVTLDLEVGCRCGRGGCRVCSW